MPLRPSRLKGRQSPRTTQDIGPHPPPGSPRIFDHRRAWMAQNRCLQKQRCHSSRKRRGWFGRRTGWVNLAFCPRPLTPPNQTATLSSIEIGIEAGSTHAGPAAERGNGVEGNFAGVGGHRSVEPAAITGTSCWVVQAPWLRPRSKKRFARPRRPDRSFNLFEDGRGGAMPLFCRRNLRNFSECCQ